MVAAGEGAHRERPAAAEVAGGGGDARPYVAAEVDGSRPPARCRRRRRQPEVGVCAAVHASRQSPAAGAGPQRTNGGALPKWMGTKPAPPARVASGRDDFVEAPQPPRNNRPQGARAVSWSREGEHGMATSPETAPPRRETLAGREPVNGRPCVTSVLNISDNASVLFLFF
jgi:hypothetical protein